MASFVKKILFTLSVYHSDAESGKSLTVPLYILSERETGLNEYRKDMHIFCINLRKRRPVLTVFDYSFERKRALDQAEMTVHFRLNRRKIPAKCPDSFRNRRKEVDFKVVADLDESFRKC